MENDASKTLNPKQKLPLGHKIALQDLKEGDTIYKIWT